jgi:hypothetical protein
MPITRLTLNPSEHVININLSHDPLGTLNRSGDHGFRPRAWLVVEVVVGVQVTSHEDSGTIAIAPVIPGAGAAQSRGETTLSPCQFRGSGLGFPPWRTSVRSHSQNSIFSPARCLRLAQLSLFLLLSLRLSFLLLCSG